MRKGKSKDTGRNETDKRNTGCAAELPGQPGSATADRRGHLRTSNPIESTFATVELRTRRTKGCGSRIASLTMVFRRAESTSRHWRTLNGSKLLADVIAGVQFVDGVRRQAA